MKKYSINNKYITFYFSKCFVFSLAMGGYFDARPHINIGLFFFRLIIKLPIKTKWNDCDVPEYGIVVHGNTFWVYTGGSDNDSGGGTRLAWDLPFFSSVHIRHSILLKDGSWEHCLKGDGKKFYMDEWDELKHVENYKYKDNYDGQLIDAKLTVEEREWRPKWLTWTCLFNDVRRFIEVSFAHEVGPRKGSWKGGVMGTGHEMLPGEQPNDTIKRMELERVFR